MRTCGFVTGVSLDSSIPPFKVLQGNLVELKDVESGMEE